MARKIARAEELFDTLNDIEGEGEYTTLCYLMGVSINNDYMEKRKNPLTNRMKNYPNFERIASETNTMGLSGFILLARYRLHWKSKKGMDKSYWDEYVPNANKIRTSFGLDPIKKQEKVSHTTMQYGSGVVVGNTDNTQGRVYSMQNGATAEKDYHYYGVTSDGEIIREFSKDEIKKYLKFQAREVDGMSALKKLTQDQAILDDYTAQMKALKFAYKKFEGDHILYAVGTSKMGGQFYFINDNLIDNVSDVYVKPYRLRELARQKCKEDYGIIAESVKKYKNITLTDMYVSVHGIKKKLKTLWEHFPWLDQSMWFEDWKWHIQDFDTIFILDTMRNWGAMKFIREHNPEARTIVYLQNTFIERGFNDPDKYNCEYYTFDPIDAEKRNIIFILHIPALCNMILFFFILYIFIYKYNGCRTTYIGRHPFF